MNIRSIFDRLLGSGHPSTGSHRTFAKFAVTGLSGVVVNLGSFHLLLTIGLHEYAASPIAIQASIISNFLLNNHWTFANRRIGGRRLLRGLRFQAVSLLTLGISYSTFLVLSLVWSQMPLIWLQAFSIAPAVILNFILNSRWTFREVRSNQPSAGGSSQARPGSDKAANRRSYSGSRRELATKTNSSQASNPS